MSTCSHPHPLPRDGTSQTARLLDALRPSSARVDERDVADWLVYATRYARLVRYFTPRNAPAGSWEAFLETDVSTIVALIATIDTDDVREAFDDARAEGAALLGDRTDPLGNADTEAVNRALNTLFAEAFALLRRVDGWLQATRPELQLRTALDRVVQSTLADTLVRLRAYAEATRTAQANTTPTPPQVDVPDESSFGDAWTGASPPSDVALFASGAARTPAELRAVTERVATAFDAAVESVFYLIDRAPTFLEETLTDHPEHEPHVGLFLAFLLLFRTARDHLNTLTKRHLEFYYRDVLGLHPRPAQPDSVHLVFELARTFNQHRIPNDTVLKAGTDPEGNDRFFTTDRELVVNTAQLDPEHGLKNVRITADDVRLQAGARGLFIVYDLIDERDYDAIEAAIEGLAGDVVKVLNTLWIAATSARPDAVLQTLHEVTDQDDTILVVDPLLGTATSKNLRPSAAADTGTGDSDASTFLVAYDVHDGDAVRERLRHAVRRMDTIPVQESLYRVRYRGTSAELLDDLGTFDSPGVELLVIDLHRGDVAHSGLPDRTGTFLHSTFTGTGTTVDTGETVRAVSGIYASPIANSADGLGAEITNESSMWPAFGDDTRPDGRVGFAVAADLLRLSEGERRIQVTFTVDALSPFVAADPARAQHELVHNVTVQASGPKAWIPVDVEHVSFVRADAPLLGSESRIAFTLSLPPDADPVVSYTATLDADTAHGPFETEAPLLAFTFDPDGLSAAGGFDLALTGEILPYDASAGYRAGDTASIGRRVYQAVVDGPSSDPSEGVPDEWRLVGTIEDFDDTHVYDTGDAVRFEGRVYQAQTDGAQTSRPDADDGAWKWIEPAFAYRYFDGVTVQGVHLQVDVTGARALLLENDQGVLSAGKPFFPFGARPVDGSRFYVGSSEIFQKSLTRASLALTWGGLPDVAFSTHYQEYSSTDSIDGPVDDNHWVRLDVDVLERSAWRPVDSGVELFANATGTPTAEREVELSFDPTLAAPRETATFDRLRPERAFGFLRVTLDGTFYHNEYSTYLSDRAIEKATDSSVQLPNPPYTPVVDEISVSYTAETSIDYATETPASLERRRIQLFQSYPFGHVEIAPIPDPPGPGLSAEGTLAPPFRMETDDNSESAPVAGALYLGVADLDVLETLSLLVQIAESSADPDVLPPDVYWSYLAGDTWHRYAPTELLSDETEGFLRSGIVRLSTPRAMDDTHTLLPTRLRWIRASTPDDPEGANRLVAVLTQAVRATYDDRGGDPSHLATALPAQTISKLKERRAAVKSVRQPFASFGGRLKEQPPDYYTRVSERLRHKQRARSIYDYERIVLAAFPDVYKVKCIPHTDDTNHHVPGAVTVIVVPDLRDQNAVDPLQPRVSTERLDTIRDHVVAHATDFARISVLNPLFEPIRVRGRVQFREGRDAGYYLTVLESDVIEFLSPWISGRADLAFGGRIHRSHILDFIEERPYVDAVVDLQIDQYVNERLHAEDTAEAVASTERSVLVSTPEHAFSELTLPACEPTLPITR